jgi:hypothetical protein
MEGMAGACLSWARSSRPAGVSPAAVAAVACAYSLSCRLQVHIVEQESGRSACCKCDGELLLLLLLLRWHLYHSRAQHTAPALTPSLFIHALAGLRFAGADTTVKLRQDATYIISITTMPAVAIRCVCVCVPGGCVLASQ